jgi:phage shock protein PspC (stress-responsive transcriptional regulator)
MKKNISINISGIIFHIEEDGYETLKKYLDSINKYFSTFEDSNEILADIESRIAEIFLSRLTEEKQVITIEDVNSLVSTMGSVNDFRAVEDQQQAQAHPESHYTEAQSATHNPSTSYTPPKQLLRDQKRKILGGVCAGLANYFNTDALWVRLLFALLLFVYGLPVLIYIVMWIFVPGSYDLDEPIVSKKMYRDPERKVIGGVSGGVAAYLDIDIIVVRVLFILFTFGGGLGVFIYIVMWLILPEAKSLTDKIQMQGDPVTLSTIESTIKKNQSETAQEESTITRILLFPFRLIGIILRALGKVIYQLLEVVRVGMGVMIVLMGLGLIFGVVIVGGVLFGIFSTAALSFPWITEMNENSFPVDAFLRAFPSWTAVAGFIAFIVPSIFILLLGVSAVAKRIIFNATVGWTLFVLFFISIAMLGVGIPKIVMAFREEAEYKVEHRYEINGKTAILKINETGLDDYRAVSLTLKGYAEKDFKLVQAFEAHGSSRAKAIENAKMVLYNVTVIDSVFIFDSNLKFKPDATFRAQELNMTLFIPYNVPFVMDRQMSRFISYAQHIDHEFWDGNTWKMTEEGLECISCPASPNDRVVEDLRDFDEIEISGKFDVRITHGDQYAVTLKGPKRQQKNYDIHRSGETLVIDYEGSNRNNWNFNHYKVEKLEIHITMPNIEKLEALGVGTIRLDDFKSHDLNIELQGPIKLKGELDAQNIKIALTGNSEADLSGSAHKLNATIELASKLKAYNLEVTDAFIETSGASSAKVNVTGTLEMEKGVSSKIEYRGNPTILNRD